MTSPMIDRLKERITELEMQNAQLQTLLACAIDALPGDGPAFFGAGTVKKLSGSTITSEPDILLNGDVVGVRVTIDPVDLPDFGGDMQGLLAREDRH